MDRAEDCEEGKSRKKVGFNRQISIMPEGFEPPSASPGSNFNHVPKYADGISWPANFLEHETVVGYPSDQWARNDGVEDVLDIVQLFEEEGLRCCILDVVAL